MPSPATIRKIYSVACALGIYAGTESMALAWAAWWFCVLQLELHHHTDDE